MTSATFDLAHVSVFDPIHISAEDPLDENILCERATASFCALFDQLKNLPRNSNGHLQLPKATIELPRSHPIPMEKPKTRFEEFARKKGLKFQKKEKKVYDEATGEWKLRYGYTKTTNEVPNDWMKEVPNGVYEDPFGAGDAGKKKEKIAEQKKRERRNRNRAERARAERDAAISAKGSYKQEQIKSAIKKASRPGSSASMNQFNDLPDKPAIMEDGSSLPKLFNRNKGRKIKGKK